MGELVRIVQLVMTMAPAPLAVAVTFGGAYNMVKCFWCGADNERHQEECCVCKRKLQWTTFFKGVLRPSVGCLLGTRPSNVTDKHVARLKVA